MPGTTHRKSKLKTTRPGKKACARYFTVVARYEDNNQSYVDHVQACDWKAAAEKVKAVSTDLDVVAVFEGKHVAVDDYDWSKS
jgi:hypothetical protein